MKISVFQIVLIAVFIVFLGAGVAAFALYKGNTASTSLPQVTIWGTFPADTFNQYVAQINVNLQQTIDVKYTQISASNFSQQFTATLARGSGPDVILIPADMILPQEDKLALIPYTAIPQRTFIDSFIQEANVYVSSNGLLALPFTIDPLVMYWNRDIFNAAGIATYPRTWDQFGPLTKALTVKDQNGNVRKSAIAMGDFSNVDNAREILGSLFLQLGNPVTAQSTDGVASTIKITAAVSPAAALQFFAKFVDPTDAEYSWNRSLPDSKSSFLLGNVATYFGFASELSDIRTKNPNLDFDVAPLPQLQSGGTKAAYGRMYGFSLVHSSANLNAAFQVISLLTQPQYLAMLSQTMYLPPVRTDVIAGGSSDPYMTIFDQAALISKTWLDADPTASNQIFGDMIEWITSGQKTVNQAIQDGGQQYDLVLKQATQ